jgi:hypothetical protein
LNNVYILTKYHTQIAPVNKGLVLVGVLSASLLYGTRLGDTCDSFFRVGTDLLRPSTYTSITQGRDRVPFNARAYLAVTRDTLDTACMVDGIAVMTKKC